MNTLPSPPDAEPPDGSPVRIGALVLQQRFVMRGVSSLVVASACGGLVASAPSGPVQYVLGPGWL
jgi:hypothetical protein